MLILPCNYRFSLFLKIKIKYLIFLFIALLSFNKTSKGQKTDSIFHINGDILTGDFKKMDYGVASYKMDGMGTISVEDVKINSIKSKKLFEIKMKDGSIKFGSFDSSLVENNQVRKVNIITKDSIFTVSIDDIVEVYPIKQNFWMRTSGSFGLGFNFTKGSNVATIAVNGDVYYRKKKSYFLLEFSDNNTYQEKDLTAVQAVASFAWQRLLKKKWSAQIAFGVSQNSELGTLLRIGFNGIGIRDIAYNNWNRLYAGAGFALMRETPYDDSGTSDDVSALFQVVWRVYKFTEPKISVTADISYLPYLSDLERYRINVNLNPSISILSDNFKIGLQFYFNLDSSPPSGATSTYDYGINLQLSYSFH